MSQFRESSRESGRDPRLNRASQHDPPAPTGSLSGLPSDWSHLLQTAARRFDMALLEEGYTGILSGSDIEIHIRYVTDDVVAWAVLAMPLIKEDEADLPENLRYFAVLNHQMMHVTELPIVLGLNPSSGAFEALLQVNLDGIDADEFADLLGDFMHQLSLTLQLAA